jgi:hypothetical protein
VPFPAGVAFHVSLAIATFDEERSRASWKALTICSPKSIEPSWDHADTPWLSVAMPICAARFARGTVRPRSHNADATAAVKEVSACAWRCCTRKRIRTGASGGSRHSQGRFLTLVLIMTNSLLVSNALGRVPNHRVTHRMSIVPRVHARITPTRPVLRTSH